MAKKKKDKDKKTKEDKVIKELGGDLTAAGGFYDQHFPNAPLSHYADPYAAAAQAQLDLRGAYANPLDARYAGNMSVDENYAINRLRDESDPNSSSFIGGNSADINDIINRFKSGLEGYTSAESAGFREQAERGLDADAANAAYKLKRSNANNRVRGAAAQAGMLGINRDRQMAGAQLGQDIFLKNADEKQNRLRTFADFTRTNDDTNFSRRQGAFRDFRDFMSARGDAAFARGEQAKSNYEQSLGNAQNNAFNFGQFNLGQDEKTAARDVGTKMGIVGLLGTRRSNERQDKIIGGK